MTIKVISLGWGVQSWTMAAMVALGEIEPVDYAVHSDTTWEMSYTYEFAKQWTPWLEDRGVKVVAIREDHKIINKWGKTFPPFFTFNKGVRAQLFRQCTPNWKIKPMRRWWNKFRDGEGVEVWIGITYDEVFRAKTSGAKYIHNRFPLLELKMHRRDCLWWLKQNNLPVPGKSSCTFCPYHSNVAWEYMKREEGRDWEQAVAIDNYVRDICPPSPLFVHSSRIPLPDAVKIPEDEGYIQPELFDTTDVCDSGYCFL